MGSFIGENIRLIYDIINYTENNHNQITKMYKHDEEIREKVHKRIYMYKKRKKIELLVTHDGV